jgi:hypothetical protein
VSLFANCGLALHDEMKALAAEWPGLDVTGVRFVPEPANRVNLDYRPRGDRREVLDVVVPPVEPSVVLPTASGCDALLFALNSGFDMTRESWRVVLGGLACPAWLDLHSLVLEPVVGRPRGLRVLADWPEWVSGVRWLQANQAEFSCLTGHPEREASDDEIRAFAPRLFEEGVRTAFVTLGAAGVMVLSPGRADRLPAPPAPVPHADTTGCGDVFAAAVLPLLLDGETALEAAASGLVLASAAAGVSGVRETYGLAAARRKGRQGRTP